jgi:hypothetical protein
MKNIFRLTPVRITTAVLVLFLLSCFLSGSLEALGWPSEDAVLFRNFGSNDAGRPVLGMVFNGGTHVVAAEKGEVFFSGDKNHKASRLPSPLGAWTAIDHGDGLISIYSRYADSELLNEEGEVIQIPDNVEKQQPLAMSGISGWSSQNGFYFMIYDRRERRWVNPSMVITPVQPNRPPQIISVELKNAQGNTVRSANLPQGRYVVQVNASSPTGRPGNVLAPQYIVCSVNGAEVASLNFEAFTAKDGIMMAYRNGLIPAKQVFAASPAYEAAEVFLSRGQATLEIIVTNNAGNAARSVTRMYIN